MESEASSTFGDLHEATSNEVLKMMNFVMEDTHRLRYLKQVTQQVLEESYRRAKVGYKAILLLALPLDSTARLLGTLNGTEISQVVSYPLLKPRLIELSEEDKAILLEAADSPTVTILFRVFGQSAFEACVAFADLNRRKALLSKYWMAERGSDIRSSVSFSSLAPSNTTSSSGSEALGLPRTGDGVDGSASEVEVESSLGRQIQELILEQEAAEVDELDSSGSSSSSADVSLGSGPSEQTQQVPEGQPLWDDPYRETKAFWMIEEWGVEDIIKVNRKQISPVATKWIKARRAAHGGKEAVRNLERQEWAKFTRLPEEVQEVVGAPLMQTALIDWRVRVYLACCIPPYLARARGPPRELFCDLIIKKLYARFPDLAPNFPLRHFSPTSAWKERVLRWFKRAAHRAQQLADREAIDDED